MSDPSRRPSEAAYAELVAAVLALRADAASERFDTLLAELTTSGLLDHAAARELRWWQRESVRAVGDHLVETVPVSLVALDQARAAALEATLMADRAWNLAAPPRPPAPDAEGAGLVVDLRSDDETAGGPAEPDDQVGEAPSPESEDEPVGREGRGDAPPLTSTRRRLLVAGLSVLPDRPTQ